MNKQSNKLNTMVEITKHTKKVCRIAVGDIYEHLTSEEFRYMIEKLKEIREKDIFHNLNNY